MFALTALPVFVNIPQATELPEFLRTWVGQSDNLAEYTDGAGAGAGSTAMQALVDLSNDSAQPVFYAAKDAKRALRDGERTHQVDAAEMMAVIIELH